MENDANSSIVRVCTTVLLHPRTEVVPRPQQLFGTFAESFPSLPQDT